LTLHACSAIAPDGPAERYHTERVAWKRAALRGTRAGQSPKDRALERRIMAQGGAVHFVGVGPSVEEATMDAARPTSRREHAQQQRLYAVSGEAVWRWIALSLRGFATLLMQVSIVG